jgi:hypothetical protein
MIYNDASYVEDHFGNCPTCRRSHGCRSVGPDHWYVCHVHKTKWLVGSNLFSTWKHLSDVEHFENARLLSGYTEVQPVRPHPLRRVKFYLGDLRRRHLPTRAERAERKRVLEWLEADD